MAGLKTDIIIKNSFTYMRAGQATGGATPGQYVHRYMARKGAVEPITPMKYANVDDFITRYMARGSAVDAAVEVATQPSQSGLASGTKTQVKTAVQDGDAEYSPRRSRGVVDPLGEINTQDETALTPEDVQQDAATHQAAQHLTLRARRKLRSQRREQQRLWSRKLQNTQAHAYTQGSHADMTAQEVEQWCDAPQGLGGVSFSHNHLSLSHEDLLAQSKHIQELFDDGHTVMKTVLSFDHDYLVNNGIVPKELPTPVEPGGYRGHVDQLKLRAAVNNGLSRLSSRYDYDQLEWVGVIQVDTSHVHCHLVMVDAGVGKLAVDGSQRGMLSDSMKATIRRGIDSKLDEQKSVAYMASGVSKERQNVVGHVKRWVYESMGRQSDVQFLLSLLPENKNHWRAATNRKDMQRANELCRCVVEDRLDRPDSPMIAAMSAVKSYAVTRGVREGLSQEEQDRLVNNGREQIIERCMNGIYAVMKDVPEQEQSESPALMQAMAAPVDDVMISYAASQADKENDKQVSGDEEHADDDAAALSAEEFVMRLRSYTARLQYHVSQREMYEHKDAEWQAAQARGEASAESAVMHDFYTTEAEYHAKAEAKYRHFMQFHAPDVNWDEQWEPVDAYGNELLNLDDLLADEGFSKARSIDDAEQRGVELYGHAGAGGLAGTPADIAVTRRALAERHDRMTQRYREMVTEVSRTWRNAGGTLVVTPEPDSDGAADSGLYDLSSVVITRKRRYSVAVADAYVPGVRVSVSTQPEYDFKDVRGVDMHDMRYDWLVDQPVSDTLIREYEDLSMQRRRACDRARLWMENVGLDEDIVDELGEAHSDINRMEDMAAQLRTSGVLRSALEEYVHRQRMKRAEQYRIAESEQGESEAASGAADREHPRHRTIAPTRQISRQVGAVVDSSVVQAGRDVADMRDREIGE